MGDGGLLEAGYYCSDSSRVDIDGVLRKIRAENQMTRVTKAVLASFARQYASMVDLRNVPEPAKAAHAPDFRRYAREDFRLPFKVAPWSEYSSRWPSGVLAAVSDYSQVPQSEAETFVTDSIQDQARIFETGDWALAVKINEYDRVTACNWLFVNLVVPQRKTKQTIIEVRNGRRGRIPFSFDPMRMRHALTEEQLIISAESFEASDSFIARVAREYA